LDGLVATHRFEKSDVGKGNIGYFFEAHISSRGVILEEIMIAENHRQGQIDAPSCAKISPH
jgi:hypothetical protein